MCLIVGRVKPAFRDLAELTGFEKKTGWKNSLRGHLI